MSLLSFSPMIANSVREVIDEKLAAIEAREGVRILFAVESGSRAWGFPSPDSDYDVRFVYAHQRDWYVSLRPGRDVIELPISEELDINGWDLRKALNLMLKPNPVMLEWLSSPIRYRWDQATCAALSDLAAKIAHQGACRHHYLSLGEGQWLKHVGDGDEVNYKKYFYILRPALALRWLRLDPQRLPPMNLQALVSELNLGAEVVEQIALLLERKARAKEMGMGPRIAAVDQLIHSEFALARQIPTSTPTSTHVDEATRLFRRLVEGAPR